jgi:hypothetical protein
VNSLTSNNDDAILEFLVRIDQKVTQVQECVCALPGGAFTERTWLTTAEVAQILKRKPYTVREWCRLGRVNAEREKDGRGGYGAWRISREELLRIQNEGLLPESRKH